MVTQLQPDVRAYLHGAEVIKRYIRVEEVAREYGLSVEETEYIAKAAGSLYKLTHIHLVKKERFDEFMKHIYKVPGTNKQIIKKFARIGEASIIYSIGRHRFIELARAAGATYKINEGTGGTVLINLEIFDNYMEQFRQPARPLKEPLYGQEEGMSNSYKFYSDTKDIMKKYVNATEGAIIYGISKSRIMVLASEAGAVYKVGNSALINTDIFEMYLEKFKEPTRPLPKHIWNKLLGEDKKGRNSTCFDKKDP